MKITLFVIFTNLSILFFYKTNHRLRPSSVKLLTRQRDKKHSNVEILEFDGIGIPLTEWEKERGYIEAALNVNIVKIIEGRNKRRILLHVVSADSGLPDFIEWNDSYLTDDDSTLILGKSQLGLESVDLSKIPHILLGGMRKH